MIRVYIAGSYHDEIPSNVIDSGVEWLPFLDYDKQDATKWVEFKTSFVSVAVEEVFKRTKNVDLEEPDKRFFGFRLDEDPNFFWVVDLYYLREKYYVLAEKYGHEKVGITIET